MLVWRRAPSPVELSGDSQNRGKNGDEFGFFNLIEVLYGGVSPKFHRRSVLLHYPPRPLPVTPLSTTFVHILRLTALVSIGN